MKSYILEKTSSKVSLFSKGPKVKRDIVITQNSGFQSVLITRENSQGKIGVITTADIFMVDNQDDLAGMIDCPYSMKYPLLHAGKGILNYQYPKFFDTANDAIRASVIKLDTPDYRGRQHRVVIICNDDGQFSVYSKQMEVN